jgi:hypothetical protein
MRFKSMNNSVGLIVAKGIRKDCKLLDLHPFLFLGQSKYWQYLPHSPTIVNRKMPNQITDFFGEENAAKTALLRYFWITMR